MANPYTPGALLLQKRSGLSLELVHEDPDEAIQGGTSGQHYHLTAAQHASLLDLLTSSGTQKIYEPVMALGELVTTVEGDCIMEWGGDYAT